MFYVGYFYFWFLLHTIMYFKEPVLYAKYGYYVHFIFASILTVIVWFPVVRKYCKRVLKNRNEE